jgi:DNA-binding PucR family transcriptional regulator
LVIDDVAQTFSAELDDTVWVAVGEPAHGLEGFRLTHRQARQAQIVASAARLPAAEHVVLSVQIGPVALMCGDVDATAAWVRSTLGELALDDEQHARLRETLWEFLESGGSFTAAAQRLILHKNTVQYRVRKAEEARGRPIKDRRLDLELALLVCRGLGSTVLVPARGER